MTWTPHRRSLLAGGAAAGLAPAAAQAAAYEDPATQAIATYSESAMVMLATSDPATSFKLRFCRFPDAGVTWLWCHALIGGRFLAFTHHRLPTLPERLYGRAAGADFLSASPFTARLTRTGAATAVQAVDFEVDLPMHASTAAPHGPGRVRLHAAGRFTPTAGLPQLSGDRQERVGLGEATLSIGRRTVPLRSGGKYHEQAQMEPRFVAPFSYFGFWGEGIGGMATHLARGGRGGLIRADSARPVTGYAPDAPGAMRRVQARLADGTAVEGRMDALVRYAIPIFGERWRGSVVRGMLDGAPVTGVMNDWRPARLPYGSARA